MMLALYAAQEALHDDDLSATASNETSGSGAQ